MIGHKYYQCDDDDDDDGGDDYMSSVGKLEEEIALQFQSENNSLKRRQQI